MNDTAAVAKLKELQSPCRLCPRECGARRAQGELGHCGAGARALVASAGAHFGEESCLVGRGGSRAAGGSGTIFLGGCNLLCLFCQNDDLSHGRSGREVSAEELADVMLRLEGIGCENVNFVTPTHFAPEVAEALALARGRGLRVPAVYNCGGYESVEALRALDGLIEIYMPDMKTLDSGFARAAMDAPDYPEAASAALVEMQRQVGELAIEDGRAVKGLLVRHLVMPGSPKDTRRVLEFLAREVSPGTFVNVMGQYRPCHRAREVPGLERRPTREEVRSAREYALGLGLRLDER